MKRDRKGNLHPDDDELQRLWLNCLHDARKAARDIWSDYRLEWYLAGVRLRPLHDASPAS